MDIKTSIDITPGAEYIFISTLIVDEHEYKYIAKILVWYMYRYEQGSRLVLARPCFKAVGPETTNDFLKKLNEQGLVCYLEEDIWRK